MDQTSPIPWKVVLMLGILSTGCLSTTSASCFNEVDANTRLPGSCGNALTVLTPKKPVELKFEYPKSTAWAGQAFDLWVGKCKIPMAMSVLEQSGPTLEVEGSPLLLPVTATVKDNGVALVSADNYPKSASCAMVEFKPRGANFSLDFHLESDDLSKLAKLSILIKAPLAPESKSKGLGAAAISGIVGAVLLILLIGAVVLGIWCFKRRRSAKKKIVKAEPSTATAIPLPPKLASLVKKSAGAGPMVRQFDEKAPESKSQKSKSQNSKSVEVPSGEPETNAAQQVAPRVEPVAQQQNGAQVPPAEPSAAPPAAPRADTPRRQPREPRASGVGGGARELTPARPVEPPARRVEPPARPVENKAARGEKKQAVVENRGKTPEDRARNDYLKNLHKLMDGLEPEEWIDRDIKRQAEERKAEAKKAEARKAAAKAKMDPTQEETMKFDRTQDEDPDKDGGGGQGIAV